jgi:hypothetical protein
MKLRRALLAVIVVSLCGTQAFAESPETHRQTLDSRTAKGPPPPLIPILPPNTNKERIGFHPRDGGSQIETNAFSLPGNDVTGEGKMVLMDGGVAITVGEIGEGLGMSADRVVILSSRREDDDVYDSEIYLEGSVVFGNGRDRVIANRLYYDVTNGAKVITDSDILSGDVKDVSDAETIRTAIHKIASRSPDNPKQRDLQVGDKVTLTFTGELVTLLFKPNHAFHPEPVHVQTVGTVAKIRPNGNLLLESKAPHKFGERFYIQTISGEIHPSHMESRNIRGEDLESLTLTICLKGREGAPAKIGGLRGMRLKEDVLGKY